MDPLMRGYRLALSVSMPAAMLDAIQEFAWNETQSMSWAVTRLCRLGLTYRKLLQEQEALKAKERAVKQAPKKPKRKTPSKTKKK